MPLTRREEVSFLQVSTLKTSVLVLSYALNLCCLEESAGIHLFHFGIDLLVLCVRWIKHIPGPPTTALLLYYSVSSSRLLWHLQQTSVASQVLHFYITLGRDAFFHYSLLAVKNPVCLDWSDQALKPLKFKVQKIVCEGSECPKEAGMVVQLLEDF